MIVVRIELYPHGDSSKAELLHTLVISNNLTATRRPEWGNYDVNLDGAPVAKIDGHFRDRGVIPLLLRALSALVR